MRTKTALCLAFLTLLSACQSSYKKKSRIVDPIINETIEELSADKKLSSYISYFRKNSIRIDFKSEDEAYCSTYDFKNGIALIPKKIEASKTALTIELIKTMVLWHNHGKYSLEALMSEEIVLAEIEAMRYFINSNIKNEHLLKDPSLNRLMKTRICDFVTMNSKIFLSNIYAETLSHNSACARPLETLNAQKIWFTKIKESLSDGSYVQLMYAKDMDRVKKGLIKTNEATRNSAILRSKPLFEIYREQRSYSDISLEKIKKFEKHYLKEVEKFHLWAKSIPEQIESYRYDLSVCTAQ